jgi:hypothetical protein
LCAHCLDPNLLFLDLSLQPGTIERESICGCSNISSQSRNGCTGSSTLCKLLDITRDYWDRLDCRISVWTGLHQLRSAVFGNKLEWSRLSMLKMTFLYRTLIACAIMTHLSRGASNQCWCGGSRKRRRLECSRVEKRRLAMLKRTHLDGTFLPRAIPTQFS